MKDLFVSNVIDLKIFATIIDIFIVVALYGFLAFMYNIIRLCDRYLDIKTTETLNNIKFTHEDFMLLENLVKQCIDEYTLVNGFDLKDYITEKEESEMIIELGSLVNSRISPTLLGRLNLLYNPNSLDQIIGNKIYLHVTAYIIKHNLEFDKK